MLKAVIFDMDGVIVDTMDLHFEAATRTLNKAGAHVTKADLKKFDTTRSKDAFRKLLPDKSPKEVDNLVDEKYSDLTKMVSGIKPYPGFREFFDSVSNYKIAVVSSSVRSFVKSVLSGVGILDKICVVLGGDDVKNGKPDPEGYLTAAKQLGVKPEECVVIEDSIYGVMSAKRAGMKVIAITHTYERHFLLDADLIVSSFSELSKKTLEAFYD